MDAQISYLSIPTHRSIRSRSIHFVICYYFDFSNTLVVLSLSRASGLFHPSPYFLLVHVRPRRRRRVISLLRVRIRTPIVFIALRRSRVLGCIIGFIGPPPFAALPHHRPLDRKNHQKVQWKGNTSKAVKMMMDAGNGRVLNLRVSPGQ